MVTWHHTSPLYWKWTQWIIQNTKRILSRRKKKKKKTPSRFMSSHLRESGFRNPRKFCLWNQESRKFLFLESEILGFGKRNTAQGIRNPLMIAIAGIHSTTSTDKKIWNPVSGIRNPRRGIQNPRLPWIPLLLGAIYKWYPIDLNDISPGKFYPNQNTNLNNFRTRGFLWKNGKVGERNWWVPKNWKSEKKVNLMLLLCAFRWRHGGHICVPKQWYDGHVYVLNQPCGSWTLFLCKRFLLFQ